MALIIFLPIPFGNVLPAMSLLLFGLGLIARDGVLLLLSLAPGAGGLALLLFSVHGMMVAFNFYGPPNTLN
ncbi:MAG: exopolysaccharide biosynthesis protein, partial [Limnohabitans sp.]